MIDVLWADASIENLSIDFDSVLVQVEETTGSSKVIACRGYLGYECIGFWDEAIIERAEIVSEDPFISASQNAVRNRNATSLSGSDYRNLDKALMLKIVLIDGCCVKIVASDFTLLR